MDKYKARKIIEDFSTVSKIKKAIEDEWPFQPGDKVKLDLDKIKKEKGYGQKLPAYKQFCEDNADRIFTVEYVEGMRPSVISLAEDESVPKWLFWTGNLKAV